MFKKLLVIAVIFTTFISNIFAVGLFNLDFKMKPYEVHFVLSKSGFELADYTEELGIVFYTSQENNYIEYIGLIFIETGNGSILNNWIIRYCATNSKVMDTTVLDMLIEQHGSNYAYTEDTDSIYWDLNGSRYCVAKYDQNSLIVLYFEVNE